MLGVKLAITGRSRGCRLLHANAVVGPMTCPFDRQCISVVQLIAKNAARMSQKILTLRGAIFVMALQHYDERKVMKNPIHSNKLLKSILTLASWRRRMLFAPLLLGAFFVLSANAHNSTSPILSKASP